MQVLKSQGMQGNQQVIFLSDGADNLRTSQMAMCPESDHVLDWFHVTMRLTVLKQFAMRMIHIGCQDRQYAFRTPDEHPVASVAWHVVRALERVEDCCLDVSEPSITYGNINTFAK